MISVFVYGTLLVGEGNHFVAASFVQSVQSGAIYGRLYDVGPYPALLLTEGNAEQHVVGEWLEVTEEGLQAMDVLEGYYGPGASNNEYDRVWIRDVNGQREGWVYIYPSVAGLRAIHGSSWKEYEAARSK